MSDFEERIRRAVRDIADNAPSGGHLHDVIDDRLQRHAHRRRLTIWTLSSIAALVVVAVATLIALQQAPSSGRVSVFAAKTTTTASSSHVTRTTAGPSLRTTPTVRPTAAIPSGGSVIGRTDGRVALVDSHWNDVATLLPAAGRTTVGELAVTPDTQHVIVLRRPNNQALAGCGDVAVYDLRSGASTALGPAVSFALSPDGHDVALVVSGNAADRCVGGTTDQTQSAAREQSFITVHDLAAGTNRTLTLGTGLAGGATYSPDGTAFAVTLCATDGCHAHLFAVGRAGTLTADVTGPSLVIQPTSRPLLYAPRLAWDDQYLLVTDGSEVRGIDPATGADDGVFVTQPATDIVTVASSFDLVNEPTSTAFTVDESTLSTTPVSTNTTAFTVTPDHTQVLVCQSMSSSLHQYMPQSRPTTIFDDCGAAHAYTWFTALHWDHWDPQSATATGYFTINPCTPSCATATNLNYPVTVALTNAASHVGSPQPLFSTMRIRFNNTTPNIPTNDLTRTGPRDFVQTLPHTCRCP
jgi:hypothetical protein